jgi:hypothetical protein
MTERTSLIAYVDVDDTLVRSFRSKRIPMTEMLRHVRNLHRDGVALYAWSSGGGEYARASAKELGIEDCFNAFLPKPNVIIDDQAPGDWRRLIHVHPAEASSKTLREYEDAVHRIVG